MDFLPFLGLCMGSNLVATTVMQVVFSRPGPARPGIGAYAAACSGTCPC